MTKFVNSKSFSSVQSTSFSQSRNNHVVAIFHPYSVALNVCGSFVGFLTIHKTVPAKKVTAKNFLHKKLSQLSKL